MKVFNLVEDMIEEDRVESETFTDYCNRIFKSFDDEIVSCDIICTDVSTFPKLSFHKDFSINQDIEPITGAFCGGYIKKKPIIIIPGGMFK